MRYLLGGGVAAFLLGPTVVVVVLTLLTTGTAAACAPTATGVPGSLEARAVDGTVVRLDAVQLGHAATIVRVGAKTEGVGVDGIMVALIAALAESRLRMLANRTTYPDSAGFPHDGDGRDHDSLGLFQMRPVAGWGSVAELMDPEYQAHAFFGGPSGPNGGSPRGLLDIPDWERLPKGAAAQAVEVSAYPDRYAAYEPVAEAILTALTTSTASRATKADSRASYSVERPARPAAPPSRIRFPLPADSWTRTSGYGSRVHPVYGSRVLHAGTDYAAPTGTPVLAVADGVVSSVTVSARGGNVVVLDHQLDGESVATAYAHLLDGSVLVGEDDVVAAAQQIAAVGSTGAATGPHLHLEVHPGGFYSPTDPEPWLAAHAADQVAEAAPTACTTGAGR